MAERIYPRTTTVSVDHATHELVLHLHFWNAETSDLDIIEVRVAERAGIDLAGQVALHGSYLARDVIEDALVGDCSNCGNTRLVEEPRSHGNGTEHVRCPWYRDRYERRGDPAPSIRPAGPPS
jgi:hypothetical protein